MSKKQEPNCGPVTVAIPNTVQEKMQAIVHLSRAVSDLARAINGTGVDVRIENCHIVGAQTGISITNE